MIDVIAAIISGKLSSKSNPHSPFFDRLKLFALFEYISLNQQMLSLLELLLQLNSAAAETTVHEVLRNRLHDRYPLKNASHANSFHDKAIDTKNMYGE